MKALSAASRAVRGQAIAITDQGLSSATNFLSVLVMARGLDSPTFGVFALAYTALTLFLGLSRAFFGVPIALAAKNNSAALSRLYLNSMSSLLILFVPVAMVVAVTGAVSIPHQSSAFVVLVIVVGMAAPLVMMQDVSRYYAIATGTPGTAILSDALWLGGIIFLAVAGPSIGPIQLIVSWGGIVAFSLFATFPRLRPRLAFREGARLLIPRRGLRESIALSVTLSTGVTLAMGFLMLPFLGTTSVGTIRAAGTLFGPVNTLIALLDFSVLGSLAKRDRSRDIRSVTIVTVGLTIVTMLWASILLIVPSSIGTILLGASWKATRTILPITSVEYVLLCVAAGLALVFKLRNRPRTLLVNRVISSVVIVGSAILFLLVGGDLRAMATALLLGSVVSAAGMILSAFRERSRFTRVPSSGLIE